MTRPLLLRALALALAATVVGLAAGIGAARLVARGGEADAVAGLERVIAHDLSRCDSDASRWVAGGEPRMFAYDGRTLRSSNPAAPPYGGPATLAIGEVFVRSPPTPFGPTTLAVRVADEGPCAVVQQRWPRRARGETVITLGLGAVAAGLALATLLGLAWIVRPMMRSIHRVAVSAASVGDVAGYAAPTELEPAELEQIVEALSSSHARVVEAEGRARDRVAGLERHLAEVAHDFRTPLTALQLSVDEAFARADDADTRRALAAALAETVYLAGLTENLRLVARHRETGSYGGEQWSIDLRDLLERVSARVGVLARRRGMRFELSIPEEPVSVVCTALAVERAISNVVENAVVHGRADGFVRVGLRVSQDGFELEVSDGGAADIATERTGSGLGLRITRGVCEEVGWTLELSSSGEGTTVTLCGATHHD
ncbi:MAG: HAMP domain-containing histidine kinase [Deltaproteobacteria bacterium]|nr:HAMP domain-containing histidine kinase [Deltaproteobacteria bacterium]